MNESKSIQEFVDKFLKKISDYGVKEGEIEFKLKDENTIIGTYHRCLCGQVRQTKTPFKNKTYC